MLLAVSDRRVSKKKKKVRVALRKNWQTRSRQRDWTREFDEHGFEEDETVRAERVRTKGELSRHRTVIQEESAEGESPRLAVDELACLAGRVLQVHGAGCAVEAEDGRVFRCAVRRLLKTLAIDERNAVAVGDRVLFRPAGEDEGMIERVDPRRGVLVRASRGREHVMVANVDQLLIIASAAEPPLKPNLVDRYLISAEQGGVVPLIVINKVDLLPSPRAGEGWGGGGGLADLQPVVGLYSQLGYQVLATSATTGRGIAELRDVLRNRETALCGQSGVGKSSLLNAVQPGLALKVRSVSEEGLKGRHTTSTAELIRLEMGGWVVDTPGIRQFELWDVIPEEVEGFFIEFRPFVPDCRYPGCTHTHEDDCGIKFAVEEGLITRRRYESYLRVFEGMPLE